METLLFLKIQEEKTSKKNVLKDFLKVAEVVQQTVQKEENQDKQKTSWKKH